MPNLSTLFKAEITRLARKEVRANTTQLHKSSSTHRSDIAALKRRVAQLEKQLNQTLRAARTGGGKVSATAPAEDGATKVRFSPKSLIAQRKRLGISAADCGLLFGTTGQSIYNWESGKARPSVKHMATLAALRKLGRRQAAAIIEARRQR
jgi:DNA-binding transcriptional regulator YiaG